MSLSARAVRGASWSALTSAVLGIVGLLQLLVLARILGPEGMGTAAMAMMVLWLGQLLSNLGITDAIVHRKELSRSELASLYWLNIAMALPIAGLVTLAAPLIARLFDTPLLTELLPMIAITIIISSLVAQFRGQARRELRFGLIAAAEISGLVVGFAVAVVTAIWFDQGVWSLIWGALVTAVITAAVLSWFGWSRPDRPYLHFSFDEVRPYLSFGKYQASASLLNFVNTRADQAIIGMIMGPHALGIYSVAFNIARQPVSRVGPIIDHVAFPILSRVQDDIPRLRYGYLRMLGILIFFLAPALVGLAVIASLAVPVVLGEEWRPAVPIIKVLAVTALLMAVSTNAGTLSKAAGYVNWSFYWQFALFLILPPVLVLAARTGDLRTVAVSLASLQVVLFVFMYRLRLRPIIGPHAKDLARFAGLPLVTAGLMGLGVHAARGMLAPLSDVVELCALIALGIVLYIGLSLVLQRGMVAEMRQMLALRSEPSPAIEDAAMTAT